MPGGGSAFLLGREERDRAGPDTLAGSGVGWRCRIVERGVRGPSCAPVDGRVVTLEQQRLVALHPGKIEPSMLRIESHRVNLAGAVAILEVGRHEAGKAHALRVAYRKRRLFHRPATRPPYVAKSQPLLHPRLVSA